MDLFANNHTKVNRCLDFVLLVAITLLGGCSSVTSISTSTSESPMETAITNSTELQVTFTPSPRAGWYVKKCVKFQVDWSGWQGR